MGFLKLNLENDMENILYLVRLLFWWAFFLSIYYQMHFCWEKYSNYRLTLFEFKETSCRKL